YSAVIDTLARRGLVRERRLLRLVARVTGRDRQLRAGVYTLPRGLPPRDLLALLSTGRVVLARVLLPEGIEADEAARRVAVATGGDAARFLAAADSLARAGIVAERLAGDPARVARLDALAAAGARAGAGATPRPFHWCEGYLAPDTYFLPPGLPAVAAARVIVAAGVARVDSLPRASGLTPQELLTLASLVEAEARRPDERPRIAAVYLNRLRLGWKLEADPTVAYALRKRGERLFYHDLAVDSPFNTYARAGLPPGPIGSPGAAALRAAVHPDPACDALFFVARGDGGHAFSRTFEAHEQAVRAARARREPAARATPPG
ncbi:MAG: endolytic transglycosylase MltG, partial [Candidatus Krumholzibacteriia bacterium]